MLIVRNGLVVDGTGSPAFPGTVVCDGDRIRDVVPGTEFPDGVGTEDTVVEATGCLVTPGFVDAHSHSDAYLVLEPQAPSKLSQGVTTEINGQCGGSVAPRYGEARLSSDWASLLGDMLTWRSMRQYRECLEKARPAINTIQFVGHNTLRSSVIGYAAKRATPETLAEMRRLLEESLDEGGWGLTTGLIYQPGKYSDSAEVTALAETAAKRGGMYATHMRSEGDSILEAIDEVIDLAKATGIRAEISHLKTSGRRNWHKIDAVLEKIQGAIDAGLIVGSDRYPYCAAGTDLDVVFPDWAGEGGIVAERERLADPATRARIAAELDASDRDWSTVMIGGTWSPETACFSGKTVAEILGNRELGIGNRESVARGSWSVVRDCESGIGNWKSAGELVCDILEKDECRTGAFFFGMSEDNLDRILSMPWIVPGSDASLRAPWGPLGKDHPHPRAYGTMPEFYRRLTGRAGRPAICSREEAIARMTAVPAKRFGIRGRGVLEKGAFADIAVWREDGFASTATYVKPHAFASGMEAVVVNGVLSFSSGGFTGARAGRFLER